MDKVTKNGNVDLKKIGKRIEEERTKRNLTQEDLAKELNINREKVSRIETGTRPLSIYDLVKIAYIFDVPTDYLLCRTNNKEIDNIEIGNKTRIKW